jgi:glycosyltransferase involved in cell wall biosynthesis
VENKKISIIVPVYNAEKYLNRCINSLIRQTYSNIEIILINDGSVDNSPNICIQYAKENHRINVLHTENKGVSNARNIGIHNASGEYLMFCDSDDWVEENWCEEFIKAANEYKNKYFFICGFNHIDSMNNCNKRKRYSFSDNEVYSRISKHNLLKLNNKWLLQTLWNKIFVTSIVKENNIKFNKTISLGEDCVFILDYLSCCKKDFLIINATLYNYNQSNINSLWFQYRKDLLETIKIKQKIMFETLEKINACSEENINLYYDNYFNNILMCLNNVMSKQNKSNVFEKINQIKDILNDEDISKVIINTNNDSLVFKSIKSQKAMRVYICLLFKLLKTNIYKVVYGQ